MIRIFGWMAVLLAGGIPATQAAHPAIVYEWVLADLGSAAFETAPQQRQHQRYIDLSILPPEDRRKTAAAVSWLCNCYNRSGQITRVRPIVDDYSVVAISLEAMAADDASYRQLWQAWEAHTLKDYVYHLEFEEIVEVPAQPVKPVQQNKGGKSIESEAPPPPPVPKTRRSVIDGSWINPETSAAVRKFTESTLLGKAPLGVVLRVDHFVELSSSPPLYYEYANIPATRNEWLQVIGVPRELLVERKAITGAQLMRSRITGAPRLLVSLATTNGTGAWLTLDNAAANITAQQDPLRFPLDAIDAAYSALLGQPVGKDKNFRWAAEEHLALNSVDHLMGALFNSEGVRQDAAPPDIARDRFNTRDQVLRPLISCLVCHAMNDKDSQWINPFGDSLLALAKRPDAALSTLSIRDGQRIGSFHNDRRLQLQANFDRDRQFHATQESTADYQVPVEDQPVGLTPYQAAEILNRLLQKWVYEPQPREQIALELGLERPADFADAMRTPLLDPKLQQPIAQQDPVILWLCGADEASASVLRTQVQLIYHDAAMRVLQWQLKQAGQAGNWLVPPEQPGAVAWPGPSPVQSPKEGVTSHSTGKTSSVNGAEIRKEAKNVRSRPEAVAVAPGRLFDEPFVGP